MSATCSSAQCKAPIFWAKSEKDKLMPMNSVPDPEGHFRIQDRHGDHPLAIYSRDRTEPGPYYTSHYATCPAGPSFRTRKPVSGAKKES